MAEKKQSQEEQFVNLTEENPITVQVDGKNILQITLNAGRFAFEILGHPSVQRGEQSPSPKSVEKRDGRLEQTLECEGGPVSSVAWDPKGKFVVTGEEEDFTVWHTGNSTWKPERTFLHSAETASCNVRPNGKLILIGKHGDCEISFWTPGLENMGCMEFDGDVPTALVWLKNGKTIICGFNDGKISFADISRKVRDENDISESHFILAETGSYVRALARLSDQIASGHDDGTVRLWDVSPSALEIDDQLNSPIQILKGHDGSVSGLAYGHNDLLYSCGEDGTVREWSKSESIVSQDHESPLSGIAFHPGRKNFATCGDDKVIAIWSLVDGMKVVERLEGHKGAVDCLSWSPDGSKLVSGSTDETMRVWNTSDLQ